MEAVRRLGLILVALVLSAATYTNPVIPGDHPDPTVVRAGGLACETQGSQVICAS